MVRQQTEPTIANVFMVDATLRLKRRELVTENTFADCIKAPEPHNEAQNRPWQRAIMRKPAIHWRRKQEKGFNQHINSGHPLLSAKPGPEINVLYFPL